MKKFIFASLLMGASALVASAQTEFRHVTFEEALSAAKKENKLVFVDFFTTWCGPCKMMSNKVFPQKEVGDFMNAKFIPLKLDAEKEGAALAKQYGVKAYPTYVVMDAEGKEVAKFSGYMDGPKFIEKVNANLDPEQSPERIRARYESGDRTPKVVNSYTMQLMEQRKEDEGFKVIDEYFASLSDADRLKPENDFLYTVYTVDLDNDRARFMVANKKKFKGESAEKINTVLASLYGRKLSTYFSGYMYREGGYKAEEFNQLKKEIADLGLDKDNNNTVIYEFVEKRAAMSDADYLKYCEDNFGRLAPRSKDVLAINVPRLFDTKDAAMKPQLVKFLRSHLGELGAIAIQVVGRSLSNLEEE
ncbi:MAG: thioredoxin family protein [Duncaniella sp.]|uniref:thioredoxin family protein n=1 Tax=Duncaniella sp. TaxID=2518496 RepID=UPI0023CDFFC2|nr:thioredoxin family protein [Duncaniella sp.]MDE5988141.1 thioredoxin family protein [Duncaniella sp.]MDE6174192.1 thioredoxin family protein [Duncaniella sp.]